MQSCWRLYQMGEKEYEKMKEELRKEAEEKEGKKIEEELRKEYNWM